MPKVIKINGYLGADLTGLNGESDGSLILNRLRRETRRIVREIERLDRIANFILIDWQNKTGEMK